MAVKGKTNTNAKTTANTKTAVKNTQDAVSQQVIKTEEPIMESQEDVSETTAVETTPKKRKFEDTDLIPCVSITPGEMFMVGEKSKTLYTWADIEDVVEVEYRDLAYMARSGSANGTRRNLMYKPRFIVQDKDFLAQFPKLEEAYGSMYSVADLKALLKLSASQLKSEVEMLPPGAKDSLKSIVATMIDNGSFDSIQRVKVLDEAFGTQMLLRLTM